MSVRIPRSLLNQKVKDLIIEKLTVQSVPIKNQEPSILRCFGVNVDTDSVFLPLGYYPKFLQEIKRIREAELVALNKIETYLVKDLPKDLIKETFDFLGTTILDTHLKSLGEFPNDNKKYPKSVCKFKGKLRPYQTEVWNEFFPHLKTGRVSRIHLYCGAGKTVTVIESSTKFPGPRAVLCHRLPLVEQWDKTFTQLTDGKCCIITGEDAKKDKLPLQKDGNFYDLYVFTPGIANKFSEEALGPIGFLITDEGRCMCTPTFFPPILKFQPKYSVVLSADYERPDGLHLLMPLLFGDKAVTRISTKPFVVFRFETGIKPRITSNARGLDWNMVIESLSLNKKRTEMIIEWVKLNTHLKIMIACKRKDQQAMVVKEQLEKLGHKVSLMVGKVKNYANARILIGTHSKMSVGFDDEKACTNFDGLHFDLLINIFSVKNIEQLAGRIQRGEQPIIVDFVDKFSSFEKHWELRKAWYVSRMGIVLSAPKPFKIEKGEFLKTPGEVKITAPKRKIVIIDDRQP